MSPDKTRDGVHAMVPREKMSPGARKLRDAYDIVPGAPLYRREFGYYCLDAWKEAGFKAEPSDFATIFDYDPPGSHWLGGLGWCEAAFVPEWEEKVLEDRGDHELVQDRAGRHVLCFKGRRSGFMPEYVDHPVKDRETWERDVLRRLDPAAPGRWDDLDARVRKAREDAEQGLIVTQALVGGYMYLRSLIGPERLLYAFYDMPDVVHDCMKAWLALADAVISRHQQHVTIDEIFFAEDICYNHGPLISPDMMREFILPYYEQLIADLRSRQIDRSRKLFIQIDTDGYCEPVIPVYRSMGVNVMSPFEVASGCDVVKVGREYPDLVITGGIDKRVLAQGKADIDRMLEYILPAMRRRGGYVPTCDHGVPAEVTLDNYLYYRKRAVELGG